MGQPIWGDSERGARNNEMPECYRINAWMALLRRSCAVSATARRRHAFAPGDPSI